MVSSWQQKGWSVGCVAQMTELVLLRGEAWEAAGDVEVSNLERDEVLAQFVEVQTAWERVYISGPSATTADKEEHALVLGVARNTNSVTDDYSPMMQACGRGLSMLVRSVLEADDTTVGPQQRWTNHADPTGITPLYRACDEGHAKVVSVLLDKAGATVDANQARMARGTHGIATIEVKIGSLATPRLLGLWYT